MCLRLLAPIALIVLSGCGGIEKSQQNLFGGEKNNSYRPDAAPKLLSAFQNSCSGTKKWTDKALNHNNSMVSLLKTLSETDACRPYMQSIADMSVLNAQIDYWLADESFVRYKQSEEYLNELSLMAISTDDDELKSLLTSMIQSTQLQVASDRALKTVETKDSKNSRIGHAVSQFGNQLQMMLEDTSGLSACLQQSPDTAVSLATNFAGIAGSFVSPVFGALTSMLGKLFSFGIQYARTKVARDTLWDMYEAQMPTALTCGLEAMSELHCQASESFKLIEFQRDMYFRPDSEYRKLWAGLDLANQDLPILNTWLTDLRNGAEPTDASQAERQNEAWKSLQGLDSGSRSLVGEMHEAAAKISAATDNAAKKTTLVNSLVDLAFKIKGGSDGRGNPTPNLTGEMSTNLYEIVCWLVKGYQGDCSNLPPLDGYISRSTVQTWIKDDTTYVEDLNYSIQPVFDNWKSLFAVAKKKVENDFYTVVVTDPRTLLAKATKADANKSTPQEAVTKVIRFLKDYRDRKQRSQTDIDLVNETVTILETSLCIIRPETDMSECIEGEEGSSALDKLAGLFKIFNLTKGAQFVSERLNQYVTWDLTEKLEDGDFPQDIDDILGAVSISLSQKLNEAGIESLDVAIKDLNFARQITEQNLKEFHDFFGRSMGQAVRSLHAKTEDNNEGIVGADRPNGQTLAQLCLLILTTGDEWPRSVKWDYCKDAVYRSIYSEANAGASPSIGEDLDFKLSNIRSYIAQNQLSKNERLCIGTKYKRASKLAEIMRRRSIEEAEDSMDDDSESLFTDRFLYRGQSMWKRGWGMKLIMPGVTNG